MTFYESDMNSKDYINTLVEAREDYFYLAYYFAEQDKEKILKLQDIIKDEDVYPDEGRETTPHITAFYGLKEDKLEDIKVKLKTLAPPKIKIKVIDSFRRDEVPYDVLILKIEEENSSLSDIHYFIDNTFENDNTYPIYSPHTTLSYINKGQCKELEGSIKEDISLTIKDLTYVDREGKKTKLPFGGTGG